MPRTERIVSSSNIYHIMMRGINRQNIFEEEEDRQCFMRLLAQCRKISGFRLYAFVLMSNHVHFLMEPEGESLDAAIKRIGTRYAMWFNKKYQRVGHLFQDRYRSEPVDNDAYLVTVLRYILQNPVKGGLANHPGAWKWSSFLAYEQGRGTLTDTKYAERFFDCREELMEYLTAPNEDAVMDEEIFGRRLREDQAKEKMKRISHCGSASEFQALDRAVQKEYAKEMIRQGIPPAQLSRMTGMARITLYRMAETLRVNPEEEERECDFQEPVSMIYDADTVW